MVHAPRVIFKPLSARSGEREGPNAKRWEGEVLCRQTHLTRSRGPGGFAPGKKTGAHTLSPLRAERG